MSKTMEFTFRQSLRPLIIFVCLTSACTAQLHQLTNIVINQGFGTIGGIARAGWENAWSFVKYLFSTGKEFIERLSFVSYKQHEEDDEESRQIDYLDQRCDELKNDLLEVRAQEAMLLQMANPDENFNSQPRDISTLEKYFNGIIKEIQELVKFYESHKEKVSKLIKDAQAAKHKEQGSSKRDRLNDMQRELTDLTNKITKQICLFYGIATSMKFEILKMKINDTHHMDPEKAMSKIKSLCNIKDDHRRNVTP